MGTISAEHIADIIDQAPAWALVGLTVPKEPLRDAARHELAEHLYARLYGLPADDPDQLSLPLACGGLSPYPCTRSPSGVQETDQ